MSRIFDHDASLASPRCRRIAGPVRRCLAAARRGVPPQLPTDRRWRPAKRFRERADASTTQAQVLDLESFFLAEVPVRAWLVRERVPLASCFHPSVSLASVHADSITGRRLPTTLSQQLPKNVLPGNGFPVWISFAVLRITVVLLRPAELKIGYRDADVTLRCLIQLPSSCRSMIGATPLASGRNENPAQPWESPVRMS